MKSVNINGVKIIRLVILILKVLIFLFKYLGVCLIKRFVIKIVSNRNVNILYSLFLILLKIILLSCIKNIGMVLLSGVKLFNIVFIELFEVVVVLMDYKLD